MGNQGRMPENVVALRQPETGQAKSVIRLGGAITDFRNPTTVSVAVSPTLTTITPSNIIEGLFTDNSSTPEAERYSKEEMLAMALHRAKKAA